eukprot:2153164-Heterocapsa_arctica.AAC.1
MYQQPKRLVGAGRPGPPHGSLCETGPVRRGSPGARLGPRQGCGQAPAAGSGAAGPIGQRKCRWQGWHRGL